MADTTLKRKQPPRSAKLPVKKQKTEAVRPKKDTSKRNRKTGNQHHHEHDHHHHGNDHHHHEHEHGDHAHHEPWGKKEWDKYWSSGESQEDHLTDAHECLLKHRDVLLQKKTNLKIFLPMCGKSFDIKWLKDLGHVVVGVEISETAVKGFFKDNKIKYTVEDVKEINGKLYRSSDNDIRIYACDFFKFKSTVENNFDAVWDSGAMHSLQKLELKKYIEVVKPLLNKGCQYLVEFTVPSCSSNKVESTDLQKLFGTKFSVNELGYTPTKRKAYKKWGINGFQVYQIVKK